jgi:hypothetical protein
LENFVDVGINFVLYDHEKSNKYKEIVLNLKTISRAPNVDDSIKKMITERIPNLQVL